jgi:riboflavin kinase
MAGLAVVLKGTVVKGFGRGSKELGIPTGNMFTRFNFKSDQCEISLIYHADVYFYSEFGRSHGGQSPREREARNLLWVRAVSHGNNLYYPYICIAFSPQRWATVEGDATRKAVMSVGWNPFYQNTKRSAVRPHAFALSWLQEIHIIHKYDDDFYDAKITMVVVGFLRPEQNFPSLGVSLAVHY